MENLENIIQYSKNLKLLYVEDNKEARESTLMILEEFFDDIAVAIDGANGLEKFEQNQETITKESKAFDLIITDINMPKMDGLTMIENIREKSPEIPIIVFSAHKETKYLLRAIELQVDGFLSKPLDLQQYGKIIFKIVKNISIKKELDEYKKSLESKVKLQVEDLHEKDKIIQKHAKMAAMGEMIDIIAHQWKQPLNIISMRTDLLTELSKDGDISVDEIIECNKKVKHQVHHLTNTLDEFRGFFRPTVVTETLELQLIFDSVKILLKDNLMKNQVELVKEFSDISFEGNKNDFKHIFINIICNAIDAFQQNNIENRKIVIEATQNSSIINIKIKDNAGGIPKNIIENIFEPNFTTKEDIGGTGIGLYMCKIIVDKYDATIGVEQIDDGSQFVLNIANIK